MRRKSTGFALILELLLVCAMLMILAAMTAPMWIEIRLAQQQQDALQRIRQYGHAVTAVNLCQITQGCVTPASLTAISNWPSTFYPSPGSITTQGYVWRYGTTCGADSLGCLTATPKTVMDGKYSFFIDDQNVVRCLYQSTGALVAATSATPVCSF